MALSNKECSNQKLVTTHNDVNKLNDTIKTTLTNFLAGCQGRISFAAASAPS